MPNMSLKKNEMPSQDPNVRNKNFLEVALGYTEEQALDEAATATRFMSGWDFYFDSDVTVDYMNLVSMLLLDQTTAEDFAKQLQQANTK